jgi:hypothetical protein
MDDHITRFFGILYYWLYVIFPLIAMRGEWWNSIYPFPIFKSVYMIGSPATGEPTWQYTDLITAVTVEVTQYIGGTADATFYFNGWNRLIRKADVGGTGTIHAFQFFYGIYFRQIKISIFWFAISIYITFDSAFPDEFLLFEVGIGGHVAFNHDLPGAVDMAEDEVRGVDLCSGIYGNRFVENEFHITVIHYFLIDLAGDLLGQVRVFIENRSLAGYAGLLLQGDSVEKDFSIVEVCEGRDVLLVGGRVPVVDKGYRLGFQR